MYDDKRRTQAGRYDVDKLLAGVIQDTTGNSPGVSFCHQFEGQVLIPSSRIAPPVTGACFSQLNGMSADGRRG